MQGYFCGWLSGAGEKAAGGIQDERNEVERGLVAEAWSRALSINVSEAKHFA